VAGGLVFIGHPYPPLGLLLGLPGYLLGGDVRYSLLAALTLAGACLAWTGRGTLGIAAALLLLFTPRGLYVLECAWTEPHAVLCLAALALASARAPRLVPVALGLLLASKQYLALAAPGVLLLAGPGRRWPVLRRGLIVAAAVTAPFLLWDPVAFWRDVVALQFHERFRPDSLSLLSLVAHSGGPRLGSWLTLLAGGAALAAALWRAPRTPAGFAASLAFALLAFFLFGKKAFANYYFFAIACLCTALALTDPAPGAHGRDTG
jgi:hypothetical protein